MKVLQDVKTRWNSTYLMSVRCLRLRAAIDQFWVQMGGESSGASLKLDPREWKIIEYLVELMHPYATQGAALSASVRPTIDLVWEKYNLLFDHLDKQKAKLQRKSHTWKKQLLPALEAAKDKLSSYYEETRNGNFLIFYLFS